MLLLFSGEGSSDIGTSTGTCSGVCAPGQWTPGPMALLADQLFENQMGYSALESSAYFISESDLSGVSKLIRDHPKLRGKNSSLYHRRGAQALGSVAIALGKKLDTGPVIAIFFRDCDGSQSSSCHRWADIRDSMSKLQVGGFPLLGLETGVPMVPNPKSEAWLICALKRPPYQDCQRLEEMSGNDSSPNSLKSMLAECLQNHNCRIEDLIRPTEGSPIIDALQIEMESFATFRSAFLCALTKKQDNWRNQIDASLERHCVDAAASFIS